MNFFAWDWYRYPTRFDESSWFDMKIRNIWEDTTAWNTQYEITLHDITWHFFIFYFWQSSMDCGRFNIMITLHNINTLPHHALCEITWRDIESYDIFYEKIYCYMPNAIIHYIILHYVKVHYLMFNHIASCYIMSHCYICQCHEIQ